MVQVSSSGALGRAPRDSSDRSILLSLASVLVLRLLAFLAFLLFALAAATLLRIGVGLFTTGVPLVFYLPAVMIVTLFAGW